MNEKNHAAAGVVRWMLKEGRHHTRMREFGDEMCRRIVAAGIPLWRGFCAVGTLHPQVAATAYVWRRDELGAKRETASHARVQTPELAQSPVREVRRTGRMLRRRLADPDCPQDYPVLPVLRQQGGTDYVAMPMVCSDGAINAITWVTDRAGGFTDPELEALGEVAEALAIIVELQSTRRVARSLLDTYVGHRTGERVLSGAITRGSGEAIRAVIWICDLRGFTRLTDSAPREEVIALLNDYFETVAEAVTAEGGEVLKFIGDAMLAIFEIREDHGAAEPCRAALKAARAAIAAIAARNLERAARADHQINFGLALHLGEVTYGNIGAKDRLDFTVIGPAVNHAARLEKLASELGKTVVTSASFAAAVAEPLESLGLHQLREVSEPQEVFTLRDETAAERRKRGRTSRGARESLT
jgi:adenylate cyclase